MNEKFIEKCVQILAREDVKQEMKILFKPLVSLIVQELYPYIYLSLLFVIISFHYSFSLFIMHYALLSYYCDSCYYYYYHHSQYSI